MERSFSPIRSVLVANRGEIAVRIFRTCRRLGIRTVAVYSDADANAYHVSQADAAVRIGPPAARSSYLDMDAILHAARAEAVDAIHPGYGFLSENADFARRCDKAGFVFIGPSADIVRMMGSKIEAKRIAETAGVPTVPGYHGDDQSPGTLRAAASGIGYPVLIKASAGGGGRGMRRVDGPAGFDAALKDAQAEALAAFGDSNVLIEKLVQNPRHIEVQLFGDRRGNLVHLFERDCSVQRNNQKLLEETPAPNLDDAVREALYEASLRLGRAIGYDSAGTVEFIMDARERAPYFLEMNTRLQVEHPVTELVTGLDLVEWQIIAASGGALPLAQEEIRSRGHAIEARITAERADLGFQPATGTFLRISPPAGTRFDTGVVTGSTVGPHYDSMLAKMIAHGSDRAMAIERLATAIETTGLLGLPTIQPFLIDALRHPVFTAGSATTGFIAQAFEDGWRPDPGSIALRRAIAAYLSLAPDRDARMEGNNPWHRPTGYRVMGAAHPASIAVDVTDEYGTAAVEVRVSRGSVSALVDGLEIDLGTVSLLERSCVGERPFDYSRGGDGIAVASKGLSLLAHPRLRIDTAGDASTEHDVGNGNVIVAPLPGVVTAIFVEPGQPVSKGDAVAQMEAMKLVHTLTAQIDGVVAAIHALAGATVVSGAAILDITPGDLREVA